MPDTAHINVSENLSVEASTILKNGNAFGALTDIGLRRQHNEDNLLA